MLATKGQVVIVAVHRHRDTVIIGDARLAATQIRQRGKQYQEVEGTINLDTLINTLRSKHGHTQNYLITKSRRNNPESGIINQFQQATGKEKRVLAHKIREWIAGTDKMASIMV